MRTGEQVRGRMLMKTRPGYQFPVVSRYYSIRFSSTGEQEKNHKEYSKKAKIYLCPKRINTHLFMQNGGALSVPRSIYRTLLLCPVAWARSLVFSSSSPAGGGRARFSRFLEFKLHQLS